MYRKKTHSKFSNKRIPAYKAKRDDSRVEEDMSSQSEDDIVLQEVDCTTYYHPGDVLAMTIAPDDNLQYNRTPQRYNKFYEVFEEKLRRLFYDNKIPYYFVIEMTEPIGTKIRHYPRLHLHGLIKLQSKVQVFKFLLDIISDLTLNCMLEIRHTLDVRIDGWNKYIHKQQYFMPKSSILTSSDDYNSFYNLVLPRGALQSVSACENGERLAPQELQSVNESGRDDEGVQNDSDGEAFTSISYNDEIFKVPKKGKLKK